MWMLMLAALQSQSPEHQWEARRRAEGAKEAFRDIYRVMWTNGGCLMIIIVFVIICAVSYFFGSKRWSVQYRHPEDEEWSDVTWSQVSSGPVVQFSISYPRVGPAIYTYGEARTIAKQWKRDHVGVRVRVILARKTG